MSDTLFIQFYSTYDDAYALYNGFSDTYDLCKTKGDFLWIFEDDMKTYKLPFTKGTVYVSAFFMKHLVQAINWSKEYPDINFVVGGPAVMTYSYIEDYNRPKNLELTTKTVEQYFGIPNFSYSWKLDVSQIKKEIEDCEILMFSYSIDVSCYWKKCIYCNYHFEDDRKRYNMDLSVFNDIDFNGHKQVRINTPGISPLFVKKLFDNMIYDENLTYDFLMRCGKGEYSLLDKHLQEKQSKEIMPNLKIRLGVEFPSLKMLEFMRKGVSVKDILNTLNIIKKYPSVKAYTMYMVGWPNLEQSDIDELKIFGDQVPHVDTISIFKTFCSVNSDLHEMFKNYEKTEKYTDDIYNGYFVNLSNEMLKINTEASNIIQNFPHERVFIVSELSAPSL